MTPPTLTITNEQANSVPLLLGILQDMGIDTLIDTAIPAHGNWEGASIGTVVLVWLCAILQERDHRMVMVREWVTDRTDTLAQGLGQSLRETDWTDDRLARVLTHLGDPETQAALDTACMQRWIRVYRLPTRTVRLDSTSVSVYHALNPDQDLIQFGYSKDHRPDLPQFKAMLATLDPLGLPISCQVVGGQRADPGLYLPAYEASVAAIGTRDVLVVGDSKMGDRATRAQIAAHGSRYLCAYRPAHATNELATWVEQALADPTAWVVLAAHDPATGVPTRDHVVAAWERPQSWSDPSAPSDTAPMTWQERVLLIRSQRYQAQMRHERERALDRLTTALWKWTLGHQRGRKQYRTEAALQEAVDAQIAKSGLTGIVQTSRTSEPLRRGESAWLLDAIWVDWAAWQAMVDRLGWHVLVSNAPAETYPIATLVAAYHQQPTLERSFSRLKTRNLQIRPVFVRDAQRIAGLVWLLLLAVRVLVLTEQRLRMAIAEQHTPITGLNPANPKEATTTPTTERVIHAFRNLTVTTVTGDTWQQRQITPLNALQQQILRLLGLAVNPYHCLAHMANSPP